MQGMPLARAGLRDGSSQEGRQLIDLGRYRNVGLPRLAHVPGQRAPDVDQLRDGGLPLMASRVIGGAVIAIGAAVTGEEPAAGGGDIASGPPAPVSRLRGAGSAAPSPPPRPP